METNPSSQHTDYASMIATLSAMSDTIDARCEELEDAQDAGTHLYENLVTAHENLRKLRQHLRLIAKADPMALRDEKGN
jgi:hypothetical protein